MIMFPVPWLVMWSIMLYYLSCTPTTNGKQCALLNGTMVIMHRMEAGMRHGWREMVLSCFQPLIQRMRMNVTASIILRKEIGESIPQFGGCFWFHFSISFYIIRHSNERWLPWKKLKISNP